MKFNVLPYQTIVDFAEHTEHPSHLEKQFVQITCSLLNNTKKKDSYTHIEHTHWNTT